MLGAFFAYAITGLLALAGAVGRAAAGGGGRRLFERYALRRVHKHGHVPELLFTFGLTFIVVEVVQLIWGKFGRLPGAAGTRFPGLHDLLDPVPRLHDVGAPDLIAIFLVLLLTVAHRVGLVVQAALSHPDMVGMLGHNVDRVFMLVFGVGAGLAAVAGVIAGPALVTQSNMAASLGPILFVVVVVGGLGSLGGAFVASLLIGLIQTFAVASNASLAGAFGELTGSGPSWYLGDSGTSRSPGRADPAVPVSGADPDLPAAGPHGNARNMSDLGKMPDTDLPTGRGAGSLASWGVWIAAAVVLALLPQVFGWGLGISTMCLMGIMIVFALSYNMLLGQTGLLSFGHAVFFGLGSFLTAHAVNAARGSPLPLEVFPLVGAATGLLFGMIFGAVSTRRAGTAFAMITLGIGELVSSRR